MLAPLELKEFLMGSMVRCAAKNIRKDKNVMEDNTKVKNIFVWGTFDILHEGHFKFFQEASKLGNLYIIVLPDKRVNKSKRIVCNEKKRRESLLKTGYARGIYIDALPDLKCFDLKPPDIFCFGYDQDMEWQKKLKSHIKNKFPQCKFIVLKKYSDTHSSILRANIK